MTDEGIEFWKFSEGVLVVVVSTDGNVVTHQMTLEEFARLQEKFGD